MFWKKAQQNPEERSAFGSTSSLLIRLVENKNVGLYRLRLKYKANLKLNMSTVDDLFFNNGRGEVWSAWAPSASLALTHHVNKYTANTTQGLKYVRRKFYHA